MTDPAGYLDLSADQFDVTFRSGVGDVGVCQAPADGVIVDTSGRPRESDQGVSDEQRRGPQTHIEKYEECRLAHLGFSIHAEQIGRNLDAIFFRLLDEFRPDT